MDIDFDLVVADAVSRALTAGQGAYTAEELAQATGEVGQAFVEGEMAALVLDGRASLQFGEDGVMRYRAIEPD